MVVRVYLKCTVCGTITKVKIQLGHISNIPFAITCGECGITMYGSLKILPEKGEIINLNLSNTEQIVSPNEISYSIEISSEFLTKKLVEMNVSNDLIQMIFSPYMRAINNSGGEKIEQFKQQLINFLKNDYPKWNQIYRLFELWGKRSKYFKSEANKLLPGKFYPCINNPEKLRAMHYLIITHLEFLRVSKQYSSIELIDKIGKNITELELDSVRKMLVFFDEENIFLDDYYKKIFTILNDFITIFPKIIPAYSIEYLNYDKKIFETDGMTTCDFEDVKNFYVDTYESLSKILLILFSLNNILYRHDFEKVHKERKDIQKVQDILMKTAGQRIEYINDEEFFTQFPQFNLDNNLRNAIGHNNYSYDGKTQKIIYIPNEKKQEKKCEIYLTEFVIKCIDMTKSALIIEEILYHLYKFKYLLNGESFVVKPEDFIGKNAKLNRNEKCWCGSGKKYKKCHGR